jgi:lysophospholipase L1-like esterase
MLNEQGEPREDMFGEDGLHLNQYGYGIWTELVMPLVVEK